MPFEIRHTLAPGESEPKVQRRVGTTFSIPLGLVAKHTKARCSLKVRAHVPATRCVCRRTG